LAKILSVANQKGGVGKTTTCVNLSAALHQMGMRVLLCDLDPQGNSTSGVGVDKNTQATIYDVICGRSDIASAVIKTDYCDLLASNKTLAGAEIELVGVDSREYRLKHLFADIVQNYDYIIIDCPPSLGLLTLNALCASDGVLIPVQCEYYALEGLSDLIYTLRAVKQKLNPELEIEGVLLTMYDSRTNLSIQVVKEIKRYMPGKIFGAVIPRNVRLSEAPSHGLPAIVYDNSSRGSAAYLRLANELIGRNGGRSA